MRCIIAIAMVLGPPAIGSPAFAQQSIDGRLCALSIRGRVIDADLGTPIADAIAVIADRDDVVRTGADGRFTFDGLCAQAELALTVSKTGYGPERTMVSVPQPGAITVRLGFAMQSVTITAPADDPLDNLGFADRIDGEVLAQTRGLSLGEALSRSAGVQVLRSGAVTKPVIDGFYGNRILIVNDGLRHHAQLWALDHAPEIDPFSASSLTVVRGAEGVRYGADAIGGVVLIEPPGFRDYTNPGFGGEGNLVGISNGRQGIANLRLESTIWGAPRWSIRAQGSVKRSGSLDAPEYPLDNTAAEDLSGGVSVQYQGRGWRASAGASHLTTEYGIFTSIRAESFNDFEFAIGQDEPINVDLFEFSYDIDRAFSRVTHTYVRGDVSVDLQDWGSLRVRYGFQRNERREFEIVRRSTTGAQLDFELLSHALELTMDHRWGGGFSGLIGASGLVQNNDHEGRRLIPDYDRLMGGVFAIQRYETDELTVAVGVRYERQTMDTSQPTRIAPNQNPPERFSLDFDALMASAQVTYAPQRAWTFDLHLATASRIPSIDELFIEGLVPGEPNFIRGDRTLDPEQTINVGLGIAFAHRWIDAEVTAYIHHINDYIYRAPVLDENGNANFVRLVTGLHPEFEYRSIDALYAGGSIELDVHPVEWLSWRSKASYVRARDLTNDDVLTDDGPVSVEPFLINIPADRYENRLTLQRDRPWGPISESSVWVESIFVRRQSEFAPNAELDDPPADYHLINAGAGTTIDVVGQPVAVSVDVQNVLNTRYRDYLSRLRYFADEPGFSAIVRMSVPFEHGFENQ